MKFSKRGEFDLGSSAMKPVYAFLGIIILLALAAAFLPQVMTSVETIGNISNLPLASFWTAGGVVVLVIVVVLFIAVINNAGKVAK